MFKLLVLAASAALASAYTTPTTQCTDGCNPIAKPGLNEVVPAGSDYTVTWQPTTAGTVTLVLLKGPSTNILPLYAVAEKIANTGTFSWNVATDLEPTGDSGYGFQLIDDADGTYQWSTQFGISNPAYSGSSSASASASASAAPSSPIPAGNDTISSAAATVSSAAVTSAAVPTGYSNSTAILTSPSSAAISTTLSTATATGASTKTSASASTSASPSSGAAAFGAASIGGAFAAIMAAVAAL